MEQEIQPQPTSKSTRSFEEWKIALMVLISKGDHSSRIIIEIEKVKPYYDQGLMPTVAFNELFNR